MWNVLPILPSVNVKNVECISVSNLTSFNTYQVKKNNEN